MSSSGYIQGAIDGVPGFTSHLLKLCLDLSCNPMDAPKRYRKTIGIQRPPDFTSVPDGEEIGRNPSSVMENAALLTQPSWSIV
ncbi:hypothetical protein V2I08_08650 [Sphingobium sp. MK2]